MIKRNNCGRRGQRKQRKIGEYAGQQTGAVKGQLNSVTLTPEQQSMVARHIGLVGVHLRTRVPTPRQPRCDREYDDLFQEGCMALVRAAARYDPKRDGVFAAYALPRIRGAIHSALHDKFSIIRVPVRPANRSAKSTDSVSKIRQCAVQGLSDDLVLELPVESPGDPEYETIRHAIRCRFEYAVQQALCELQQRRWRRRNPCAIMTQIADERLLVSQERMRTPLRQIARQAGVSSSRASAYEQLLIEAVHKHFAGDDQVLLLIRFANEDPAGFEGLVDAPRSELLIEAELTGFDERFTRLERSARAELVYTMIERSAAAVAEVARNLYLLTISDENQAMPFVA